MSFHEPSRATSNRTPWVLLLTLALATVVVAAPAAPARAASEHAMPAGHADLGKLGGLVGTWEGTDPTGKPVRATYEWASGGSALVEHLSVGDEPAMMSVYHLDGDHLMMTHYCSMGNQPQMVAQGGATSESVTFEMTGITNLASPDAPHMDRLRITFVDADHLVQEWGMKQGNAEQAVKFDLHRAGASS